MKLETILNPDILNLADKLDEDLLDGIGSDVHSWVMLDDTSREEWKKNNDEWSKLALQICEEKTYPWPQAANVKYPLVTLAAMQFASRAYSSLINEKDVVKGKTIGNVTDEKRQKAERVGSFMTYQVMEQMQEWPDDMDRLLHIVPIVGCAFKKTYYSTSKGRNVSELVLANDLIVNFYSKNFENALRKTHVIYLYPNEVEERIRGGVYRKIDIYDEGNEGKTIRPGSSLLTKNDGNVYTVYSEALGIAPPTNDPDTPHKFFECHCWYDLDEDGYKEPYIITVHDETKQVVRIVPRFEDKDVVYNDSGKKVLKINAIEYFTKFPCIPNPESGTYDFGFGRLLGPINETVNTALNQLLDAGSLSNLQSGFLAKGIRLKGGNTSFKPGEWKVVQSTGDDLRKGVFPLPVKEPSTTLYNLLGMMINAGQQVASINDLMLGKNPGQNQPLGTTQIVAEEGMKLFSAIHKRLHRALKREFRILFKLNSIFLPEENYFTVLDDPNGGSAFTMRDDFELESIDVIPSSDPDVVSEQQTLIKATTLLNLIPLGTINPQQATLRILQAQKQDGIEQLMQPPPPPPPDPEIVLKQQEFQHKQQMDQMNLQLEVARTESEIEKSRANAMLALAKAQATGDKSTLDFVKAELDALRLKEDRLAKRMDMYTKVGIEEMRAKNSLEIAKEKPKLVGAQ